MFSLLLEHFERDLSRSRVNVASAFSLALLTEGALAILVGLLIDAGRARVVMCVGSLLAGASFIGNSLVQNQWQLYAAWIAVGMAMSGTLYPPAFSVLIRRYPADFRRAIITLTFLAGLASTVFIPLGSWLISAFSWRTAVIALDALHLLIVSRSTPTGCAVSHPRRCITKASALKSWSNSRITSHSGDWRRSS